MTLSFRSLLGLALLVSMGGAPGLVGCASTQPAKTHPSGFLGDYGELSPSGDPDDPDLSYVAPDVDWASYDKILLDPVTLWQSQGTKLHISQVDGQRLANNFYILIHQQLAKDYTMVTEPGPGTLRIAAAITQAEHAKPALNVISSIVPQLRALTRLEGYVAGKPPFTGEAAIEVRVLDAENGDYLWAEATRRVGQRQIAGSWKKWKDVDDALQFWAEQLAWELCKNRGGENCVAPKAARGI